MMENIKYWDEVKDYFFITLGIMLYTISFTVFLMPYQIVAGGVTGLSAIIYYATGFHVQNTYIIINLSLLVVALKVLGFKFLFKTIYAIFLLYFLLIVAQDIIPKQPNGNQASWRRTGLHVYDYRMRHYRCGTFYGVPA